MTAPDLSTPLRQLADLADIRGASIDAAAWRQLAADIAHTGAAPLLELAQRNRLTEITIHSSLHARLRGLLLDSPDTIVRAEWAGVPWLLRRLMEFALVDPAGAAALARLGIVTVADLDGALQDGRVATHLASYQDRLRIAVDALSFERPRVPLGRAVDLVDNFIRLVAAACPDVQRLTPAGDVRRFEPLVESLVVVASAADPQGCLDAVSAISAVQSVLHRTSRRAIVSYQHTEMDIRIAAADEFGTALHVATGSHTHIGSMRTRQGGARLCAREEDVYSLAGLAWIPPEIRQGTGEIEAAGNGTLPALVAREHIRGDLHMHTTYSDGRDSLAEMVQAGAALGYEYIAITDHSERAGASRTVSTNALARQRREIVRLRARFPAMAILHGIEVDIMPDGSLDFPDRVLQTLDIVLASLHDRAGQDPARLTDRCLAAIRHPLVNIITHPANRLVGRDPGYEMDFDAIYAAAAANGTALEIDGAPSHLDLDGEHARAAVAAGVTVAIDSDCHSARLLDKQMRLGIGTARRGWVEEQHVLNTRPLADLHAFLAAKRRLG